MKWILIVLLAVILVIAVVAAFGAALPVTHSAIVTIQLGRPVGEVWPVVAEIDSWPSWNSSVTGAEVVDDSTDQPIWAVVDSNGRIISKVLESTAPMNGNAGRFVTRIVDPDLPFGGTWTWTVSPTDNGCTISIREDGEIYNVLFRFMARYVFGYTATAQAYLNALGQSFGEDVTPSVE